jgi:hypothetical protein
MGSRLELQALLETTIGNTNVYYNPPPNIQMVYPAIKFNRSDVDTLYADSIPYTTTNRYTVTVIGKLPNDSIVDKLLSLPMCSFDRHYTYDGLNHDVLKLFY